MSAPPTPTWDEFARALRKELRELPNGVLFVINHRERPWHYAQFAQYLDQTYAEVSGETVEDPAIEEAPTPEGTRILESLGWQRPMRREGLRWHRILAYPPTSAEYREVVNAVVTTLRDVNGVPGPQHLTYRAWNGNDNNKPWRVDLPGATLAAPPTASD